MVSYSRLLALSTISVLAASSFGFVAWQSHRTIPANRLPASQSANVERAAPRSPQAQARTVRVKTHVLLVSAALIDDIKIDYNLKVPMHHVRPDTAETITGAALIDDTTVRQLLKVAYSGPGNGEYSPEPDEYAEGEDEFDCLSDYFRGSEPLPPDLYSSVINGLSLAYNFTASSDRRSVVLAPVTIMRADYPAAEIPNTAAHEAKYANHVKIDVPNGGTLLIDGGPVKATRTEANPSRHLLVLLQPSLIGTQRQEMLVERAAR